MSLGVITYSSSLFSDRDCVLLPEFLGRKLRPFRMVLVVAGAPANAASRERSAMGVDGERSRYAGSGADGERAVDAARRAVSYRVLGCSPPGEGDLAGDTPVAFAANRRLCWAVSSRFIRVNPSPRPSIPHGRQASSRYDLISHPPRTVGTRAGRGTERTEARAGVHQFSSEPVATSGHLAPAGAQPAGPLDMRAATGSVAPPNRAGASTAGRPVLWRCGGGEHAGGASDVGAPQSALAALSDGARAGGVPSGAPAAAAPQFAGGGSADGSHAGAGVLVSLVATPEPALGAS